MDYYISEDILKNKIVITKRGGLKGVIDIYSNVLIPIENIMVEFISYNYTIVKHSTSCYYLYNDKNQIVLKDYDCIEYINNGFVLLTKIINDKPKYGVYSISHKRIIIDVMYDNIEFCKHSDRLNHVKCVFIVDYNNLYIQNGVVKKEIPYDIHYICSYEEGFAIFVTNDFKYGILNIEGEVVFKPDSYDFIHDFKNKACIIKNNDLYGMLNANMEYIVEPKYVHITDMNKQGLAAILTVDDRVGYIDTNGNEHLISIPD